MKPIHTPLTICEACFTGRCVYGKSKSTCMVPKTEYKPGFNLSSVVQSYSETRNITQSEGKTDGPQPL